MALFKKDPPKTCPKCGASSLRCMIADTPESADLTSGPVNAYTPNLGRGAFGASLVSRKRKSERLTYHCDNCGFEQSY